MLSAVGGPHSELLRSSTRIVSENRERGDELFSAGNLVAAAEEYRKGLSVASAAKDATVELDQASLRALLPVFGELAKQRTTCLINRAACAIRLGRFAEALDDTWAAIESCFTPRQPCTPPWQRSLESSPGWEWRRGGYVKAVLRRAEAAVALGVPMLPISHVVWATRHVSANGLGAASTLMLTELKARHYERMSVIKPPPDAALNECLLPASWSKMKLRPGAIAPAPRFGGASAAVGDSLYLFGGTAEDDGGGDRKMGDAWRLSLSSLTSPHSAAQLPAWELLPVPARHGGPSAGRPPCGAACEDLQLFVVLASGVLWTLAAGAGSNGRAWLKLGCPSSPSAFANNGEDASLTVAGTTAIVFHAPEGLFQICLRTGQSTPVPLTGSRDCFNRPKPLLWPAPGCGAAPGETPRLRVWSGDDALDDEGVGEKFPPLSEDMWCFEGTEWRVAEPGGGGGAVPPRRTEAALAPLPGGRAVLMGGFTDRMSHMVTVNNYSASRQKAMFVCSARVLDDSYLWDSQRGGWRVLRCGGEQPPPAASACLALHDASGTLLTFGGWGDAPIPNNVGFIPPVNYTFPLSDIYLLHIDKLKESAEDKPRCAHCSRKTTAAGEKLMRCARCRRAFYCSKECQHASWTAHRADCKAI